ncbi:MAG: hypothetical protein Ta2F_13130 [Termitinemataceae bacterium]|nr:MAG: hypothetical protein Ta2F_13130 [Termitinemataceae bacterium]
MKKIIDSLIEYKNIFVSFFLVLISVFISIKNGNKIFLDSLDKQRRSGFIFLCVFLSFYCSAVFLLPAFSGGIISTVIKFSVLFFIILPLLILFCRKLDCRKFDRCVMKIGQYQPIRKETVIIFSSACFLILLLSLLANFPGAKSPDTEGQWRQVQTLKFNDWHPIIHTLFIWLVSRIINHYAFVIFAQIAVFSFGVGYLAATLEKWGFSKKIILLTGCFVILNPYTQNIMMYAWKDLALTICITYLSTMMINTYLSGGKWLEKSANVILFALLLGITSKIRHNGIFFTIPLACLVPICYFQKYKKSILCLIFTICIILAIRFPLYSALKAEFLHNGIIESVGIPMTIMADVMVKEPQSLPMEAKEFLNKIATDDEWYQDYHTGDYNSIKFHSNSSDVVSSIPFKDFINMTIKTIKSRPGLALIAVRDLTKFVWELDGTPDIIDVPVGTIRFFHFNVVITVPLILVLLSKK